MCKCELETFNYVQFELESTVASTLKLKKKKKKNSHENNVGVVVEKEVDVVGVTGDARHDAYVINHNHSQSVSPSYVFLHHNYYKIKWLHSFLI